MRNTALLSAASRIPSTVELVGYKTQSSAVSLNITTTGLTGGISSSSAAGDVAIIIVSNPGLAAPSLAQNSNYCAAVASVNDTYDGTINAYVYYISSNGQTIIDNTCATSATNVVHIYVFRTTVPQTIVGARTISAFSNPNTANITFPTITPTKENCVVFIAGLSAANTGGAHIYTNPLTSVTTSNTNTDNIDITTVTAGILDRNYTTTKGSLSVDPWTVDFTDNTGFGGAGIVFELWAAQEAYFVPAWNYYNITNSSRAISSATTYTFKFPVGVTSFSAVAVGGGEGGGNRYGGDGGSLAYVNNISITSGQIITVTVGDGGSGGTSTSSAAGGNGGTSSITVGATVVLQAPGGASGSTIIGTGFAGGNGGAGDPITLPYGAIYNGGGGGGAGGYAAAGGAGRGASPGNGTGGTGGSGGGGSISSDPDGSYSTTGDYYFSRDGGAGGGVGIWGQGNNGAGGVTTSTVAGTGGTGSKAKNMFNNYHQWGGGGAGGNSRVFPDATVEATAGFEGFQGAVRIIWGAGRSFPSTNTDDL